MWFVASSLLTPLAFLKLPTSSETPNVYLRTDDKLRYQTVSATTLRNTFGKNNRSLMAQHARNTKPIITHKVHLQKQKWWIHHIALQAKHYATLSKTVLALRLLSLSVKRNSNSATMNCTKHNYNNCNGVCFSCYVFSTNLLNFFFRLTITISKKKPGMWSNS